MPGLRLGTRPSLLCCQEHPSVFSSADPSDVPTIHVEASFPHDSADDSMGLSSENVDITPTVNTRHPGF